MSLLANLLQLERHREAYWRRYPAVSPVKLRWRALTVRHCLHVLPGESVLEIGAGTGLWTEHLTSVLRGENPIAAAVFNEDLLRQAREKDMPNVRFLHVADLAELPAESFDYVVGTAILCHTRYEENLRAIYRLLKPGGRILFFEANYWNPQVFLKSVVRPIRIWAGDAQCQRGLRRRELAGASSRQGFTNVQVIPYDILHPRTPLRLLRFVQAAAFVLERAPVVREFCGTLYIWAKKPGDEEARRPPVSFRASPQLAGSTSVVVPCRNEEMNVPRLAAALLGMYGSYIREIIFVNDNSSDRTGEVAAALAARDPRIKVINRKPPNGVGRALRDGYAAATGRYILTMDSDFVQIVPEFRDLFDAIQAGHDGAIGSRFSHESVLINYPFTKVLCNRMFHLLLNLTLGLRVRDVSNNLKLYRTEILKDLGLEQDHFAANVETGLKPLLAGYDVCEVPMSWINRTAGMGKSSFAIVKVAPGYARALWRIIRSVQRNKRKVAGAPA